MFGAVSDALVPLGYAALNFYAQQGSAISGEASTVELAASRLVRAAEPSVALFGARLAAISELLAVANECSEEDWDGEGAFAVDPQAVARAERFLRAIPDGVPMPSCSPEPDGSISLDWAASGNRFFSVSVPAHNRLAYAWLSGSDKAHGVARFDGFVVPEVMLFYIRSVSKSSHAAVRTA